MFGYNQTSTTPQLNGSMLPAKPAESPATYEQMVSIINYILTILGSLNQSMVSISD